MADCSDCHKRPILVAGEHERVGRLPVFAPFDGALLAEVEMVGPAIAAGCPVIVKPAEDAPLSCFRFVRILREAGLPEAWCQALMTLRRDLPARPCFPDRRAGQ